MGIVPLKVENWEVEKNRLLLKMYHIFVKNCFGSFSVFLFFTKKQQSMSRASVLVCFSCYNKISQTVYLKTAEMYFSQAWRLEGPDQGASVVRWERSSGLWTGRRRPKNFSRVSFIRGLISFTRAPPSWPKHLPKTLLLNTFTLGISISKYESGGDIFRP